MPKQRKFQDAPVPAKKPKLNKRTVFDNRSDEEEEVEEKVEKVAKSPSFPPKNQQKSINPESSLIFENYQPVRDPKIWPYLEIHGPLPKITCIGSELIQNRRFVIFFQNFTTKIHKSYLKFRGTVMMETQNRRDVPEIDEILVILRKLLSHTMQIDNARMNVSHILESIRQLLENGTTSLDANDFPEFYDQLHGILSKKKMRCSDESVLHLRNELLRHFFLVSVDLITCVVSMDTNRNKINGFRQFRIFSRKDFKSKTSFESMTEFSSLHGIFVNHLRRSEQNVSLWMTIPCDHKNNEHLLENVFESGLIPLLPEDVRRFLTDWMIKVKKRMRTRLENGDLRRAIESIFGNSGGRERSKRMPIQNKAIRDFLKQINGSVLNCVENFEVFGGKWADSVIHFIQNPISYDVPMNQKMRMALNSSCEETPATVHLSSLFSKSPSHECLLSHTLLQLYRFMIYFSFATLRHVFYPGGPEYVYFNWKLDEEVTDFKKIIKYEKTVEEKQEESQVPTETPHLQQTIVPSPTPFKMEVPNVSYLPSHFNPPVPPPTYMPTNYMPIHPPVTFNQQYYAGNPSEIHQFQPEIKQNWPPIEQQKKQFSFQPLPPSSSYPPSGQINPKMESIGTNVSSEVTEEELSNARALRTPSEVSGGGLLNLIDDDDDIFEGVPKKWIKAYKLALEWNEDLKAELEKVKNRLERLS